MSTKLVLHHVVISPSNLNVGGSLHKPGIQCRFAAPTAQCAVAPSSWLKARFRPCLVQLQLWLRRQLLPEPHQTPVRWSASAIGGWESRSPFPWCTSGATRRSQRSHKSQLRLLRLQLRPRAEPSQTSPYHAARRLRSTNHLTILQRQSG